ncbi:phage terminase small subunit [Streptomyces griseofuscus]
MTSGGARSRSGPAPDPTALRRDRDAGEWTVLPAEGRQGATPDWPLTDQTGREADLWERLWEMPQALMWERYGQELEVALYVRRMAEAEKPDAFVGLSTLVRQMSDSLGLTTPGMRANRWRIERSEGETARQEASVSAIAPNSARARLKALSGGSS